jgi:hypothetical protein
MVRSYKQHAFDDCLSGASYGSSAGIFYTMV